MAKAILMPKSGPTIESCVIGNWEKRVGEQVKEGDILFTYETDKTSYECVCSESGILLEIFFEEGDEVPVLTNVCAIGEEGEDCSSLRPGGIAATEKDADKLEESVTPDEIIYHVADNEKKSSISPRARKLAEDKKINISFSNGSGPQGRIIEKDIKELAQNTATSSSLSEYEDIKLSTIRRTISKTMHKSLSSMAQLTHNTSFDASCILAYRKKLKENKGENADITLGDIILYVVSRTLLNYPDLNANMLDDNTIRHFKCVNLGVAVDTPRGLMVPTIFNADKKSLLEISKEVKVLAAQCREGNIPAQMLTGGSFTVTNLGSLGVESFTPIINPPQTAILGVCGITQRLKDDASGSYSVMGLSLTYDHRAIDGTPAARFQKELCKNLENFTDFLGEKDVKTFKKAAQGAYDLLVVGGGPGGYLCAERAAQNGMKVALFEKKALGGTCLNEGCIPTKTFLNSAKMYRHASQSEDFGVTAENVSYNHTKVVERKNEVVKKLVFGVGATMKANKVEVISADATIKGKSEKGFVVIADEKEYLGTRLVIATGSETVIPPIKGIKEGLDCGFVYTSREVLDETQLPETLVVIGGGVIGLEMAYYFASVGSKVTVIEAASKIAGNTDDDICKVLTASMQNCPIEFKLSSKVLEVKNKSIVYEENGESKEIFCDKVLLCAGRTPRTEGLGIENLYLDMERAAVKTDLCLCTNVEDVYAIGDCNGKSMLAHTAYREAEVAVNHMLGKNDMMRYDVIPSVIYTDPEVACVGLTKEEALQRGIKAKEVKLPMSYAGRYVAETNAGNGFIKIVADTERNILVGCHMVGSYASEIIMTATMMIDTQLSSERLQKLVFPHPTVAEIIREAIFKL